MTLYFHPLMVLLEVTWVFEYNWLLWEPCFILKRYFFHGVCEGKKCVL